MQTFSIKELTAKQFINENELSNRKYLMNNVLQGHRFSEEIEKT
jgi:hypothetical protein